MDVFVVANLVAGIPLTQVGNALADGRERFTNCIRPDGFILLAEAAISPAEDKEVSELGLLARDITEVRGFGEFITELAPEAKDFIFGLSSFGSGSSGGDFESRAEFSVESVSGFRVSKRQGVSCG